MSACAIAAGVIHHAAHSAGGGPVVGIDQHLVLFAEIGALDVGIGQHGGGIALGDLAAEIQHHDAVGDVHHHAHVVLDHHHGHAELFIEIDDVARHVLLFLEVHAGHRLVEQDQLRLQRHGAGQFDALAQAVGQGAGGRLAHRLQVEEVDDLLDLAAMLELLAPRAGQPVQRSRDEVVLQEVMPPDHDVVEHAHVLEQRQVLEGAADAEPGPGVGIERGDVLPAIEQLAFGRPVAARNAIDDRGLAGAVGADDREQLAVVDAKTDIGERTNATEA